MTTNAEEDFNINLCSGNKQSAGPFEDDDVDVKERGS